MSEVIPAEAVEAAACAVSGLTLEEWRTAAPEQKQGLLADTSAALTAAAPYIEKEAYERGWGAGFRHHKDANHD